MTRIGLIGAGRWGKNAARAIAANAELAWIVDADIDAAVPLARDYIKARGGVYTQPIASTADRLDYRDDMLGGRSLWDLVDACWICTPIETHELLVHDALTHGKHVLCEKPLARSKAQAEDFAADAKRRGLVLMADHTWLAHAGVTALLGDSGPYEALRKAPDDRGFDPIEDLLPHDAALIRRHKVGETLHAVRVRNESTDGMTWVSFDHGEPWPYRERAHASYSYVGPEKKRVMATNAGFNTGELPTGSPEPLTVIVSEFLSAIAERREPRIGNAAEFIHVAAVIEAAKESRKRGGEWVDVQQ